MKYSFISLRTSDGPFTHEGHAEIAPGESIVIPRSAFADNVHKDKAFSFSEAHFAKPPMHGFDQSGLTINGTPLDDADQLASAVLKEDTVVKNTGKTKAFLVFRVTVAEAN